MAILKSARARAKSITSAIGSGLKSAASKAVNTVKNVVSSLSTAKGTGYANVSSSLGSTSTSSPSTTSTPPTTQTNAGNAFSGDNLSSLQRTTLPQVYGTSSPIGTYAPSPIYSAPTTLKGGESSSSLLALAPTSDETVITSESMGGSSSPTGTGTMSSSPSYSLPSAPTYSNPGTINNGGLVNSLTGDYTYDPNTNTFAPVVAQGEQANPEVQRRTKLENIFQKLIPKKDNLYEDPLIRQQNEEVQRRKAEVASYTSQLNSVVAQQNADLLRLRGIGSQEGVTETVYGGQAAVINREAAIKALPIQAQISAAQGNLELAQDYLTQLTTWKQEEITNEYNYKTALYSSIKDFVKGEEKIRLDELTKNNDRAYTQAQSNIQTQDEWARLAITNSQSSLVSRITNLNPNDPNFRTQLGQITSKIVPKATTTGGNTMIDNERALMTQFRGEQIVKDYNEILAQKGTIDAYVQNGVGGPRDLALVFSFMKGLDPTSVVRESEYDNAAKSGNIFAGAFAKFNGYFKEKGGILPANVRQEFQNLVNLKLQVKQAQYDNLKKQYEGLAGRQGLNAQNVVIDYAAGGVQPTTQPKPYTVFTPKGQLDMSLFEK